MDGYSLMRIVILRMYTLALIRTDLTYLLELKLGSPRKIDTTFKWAHII